MEVPFFIEWNLFYSYSCKHAFKPKYLNASDCVGWFYLLFNYEISKNHYIRISFLTLFSLSSAEPVTREEFTSVLQRLEAIEEALGVVKAEQVESIAKEALATVELSTSKSRV